ncbi:beta-galactosidase BglB [Aeromonas rivipollensis]|uniref:beta-galactosidase BglB n=1 Tax=Aeromonas rivipollensis TaxID=948519 RepID=UPI001F15F57A|nr:glycoside hydrolase family 88 protein [Aeromonas rivipollensis]MCE9956040.1 glycoside hydrolase family 88 protein [Aeromonas rivipollensis]MDM5058093.1 glycoside hydrolase family 88 protein [Aeromonas rivipollensis]
MKQQALIPTLERVVRGFCQLKGMGELTASQGLVIQFEQWEWEVGVGLYGFWRYARHKDDAELQASLLAWYEGQIAKGLPAMQINTTAPMITLALLAGHSGRADLREVVNAWADDLLANLPRTEEGGFQHVVKEQPNTGQLWDDTLFMTCLFLGTAGRVLARQDLIDEAVYQFLLHTRYLSEPKSGLWYHGWTFLDRHHYAEAFWARGNAWITVAIPEFIDLMGEHLDAGVRRYFTQVVARQVRSLCELQADNGMWHTVLDDPFSPQESSATAGIAYGMLRCVRLGLLDESTVEPALRAARAVWQRIDGDGIVLEASKGTMVGHDHQYYCDIAMAPVPYAQALTMLLLLELEQGQWLA